MSDTGERKWSEAEKEGHAMRTMRKFVVASFCAVGPVVLLLLAVGSTEPVHQTTMLDIFKIWLGALIGISTSLLQKTPSAETMPVASKDQAE